MNTTPENLTPDNNKKLVSGIASRAAQILLTFIAQGIVLFLAAGRVAWGWGWLFLGIYLASTAINGFFLLRTNPETAAERGQPKEMRNWDKVIGGLWGVAQFLALPVVAGLDVRFGWAAEPALAWHVVGAIAFAAGLELFGWAMITNAYFSTAVRIQTDRGQSVCRSGPYQVVRHPGYVGAILQSLAIPLLLGSWWAFTAGVIAAALMITRTALEDKTLQNELPGYQEFAREVRYRLLPGVW